MENNHKTKTTKKPDKFIPLIHSLLSLKMEGDERNNQVVALLQHFRDNPNDLEQIVFHHLNLPQSKL